MLQGFLVHHLPERQSLRWSQYLQCTNVRFWGEVHKKFQVPSLLTFVCINSLISEGH